MTISINEQDRVLATILSEMGIKYLVVYCCTKENALGMGGKMDSWKISFTGDNFSFEIDYFTGIGHRVEQKLGMKKIVAPLKGLMPDSRVLFETNEKYNEMSYVWPQALAVAPTQASVLHYLLINGETLDYDFDEWCDMFGYDNDSIKAESTFRHCREVGRKARKLLGDKIDTIREILEDY